MHIASNRGRLVAGVGVTVTTGDLFTDCLETLSSLLLEHRSRRASHFACLLLVQYGGEVGSG